MEQIVTLEAAETVPPSSMADRSNPKVSGTSILLRKAQNNHNNKAVSTVSTKIVRTRNTSDASKLLLGSKTCVASQDCRSQETLSHSISSQQSSSLLSSRPPPSPLYDPMRVVTTFQLQALELLDTTPIWIFDFIQRKNRWANAAGLKLWDAPNLQEFLNRDMTDMSETARLRTQKIHDRISQGQKAQEQWTFYPKGKARTVAVTLSGMRLSPDDDHCSMFVVGTIISLKPAKRNKTAIAKSRNLETTSITASCGSSSSQDEEDLMTLYEGEEDVKCADTPHPSFDSHTLDGSMRSLPCHEAGASFQDSTFSLATLEEESKCCEFDNNVEEEELEGDDTFLRNNLLENLRMAEIVRYLPTAVCQFDINGRTMYQNPAAYLPEDHDCANAGTVDQLVGYRIQIGESKEEDGFRQHENVKHDVENVLSIDNAIPADGASHFRSIPCGLVRRFVDPNVASDVLARLRDGKSATINMEAELHTNEKGKTQWSAIQLRKALDPVTGESVILFSSFDRSDAIEAQKERKARIAESEFLAIMAHEIRTPLHQVTGFIDLLECASEPNCSRHEKLHDKKKKETQSIDDSTPSKSNLNEEQRGYIKLLRSSAAQLMTVINDVLDYSKLEAGQMKIEKIPFEPMSVVKGSIAAMQGSCEEKGLFLTMEYGKHQLETGAGSPFATRKGHCTIPFRIIGDPNRLRQVLLNLLSNAIKFTNSGGIHVQVSSYVTDCNSSGARLRRWIRFVVTDTGVGISRENQAAVFQKYRQANTSDARKFGGTGLGLTICQSLVQKMGGTIGVDSQLGQGSSFWFSLPIETPQVSGESVEKGADGNYEEGPTIHLNILVAEDNKINQKLVANMLKRMGHNATMVDNGHEAIKIIEKLQDCSQSIIDENFCQPTSHSFFDAVLMDIQMPVMDGLEATRRLRHMGYTDLPILGLTASQKRSDFEELGFDDWLPKPIPMKELKVKLSNLRLKSVEQHVSDR